MGLYYLVHILIRKAKRQRPPKQIVAFQPDGHRSVVKVGFFGCNVLSNVGFVEITSVKGSTRFFSRRYSIVGNLPIRVKEDGFRWTAIVTALTRFIKIGFYGQNLCYVDRSVVKNKLGNDKM